LRVQGVSRTYAAVGFLCGDDRGIVSLTGTACYERAKHPVRHHWYRPGFWRWWWSTQSMDAKALTVSCAVALFGAGGYFAVDALPNTGWTSGREVVTMTEIVRGKVVYRTIAGRVETLRSRTNYATVTQPSGIVTVAARGKPATTESVTGAARGKPARTEIVTVAARGKPATTEIVTVAARGKPATTEITRTVTVDQRQLVRHLVTHQQTVTVQQTVTAGGRMVTN